VHAEECGLLVHRLIEREIVAVHQHGRACVLMELAQAANRDRCVRAVLTMTFTMKLVASDQVQDARDFRRRGRSPALRACPDRR